MTLRLYDEGNSYEDLRQVVDLLNDGGVIIFPTDGRYALGCHALKKNAIDTVCRMKGINPQKNRLSMICYDLSTVSEFTRMDNHYFKLIRRNVPGPFTFIFQGTNKLPKVFLGRKEVGIRMPDCAVVMEIVKLLEAPLLVASLPLSDEIDEEYYTDPELIDELLGQKVDLIIDGGIGRNVESTVVDCRGTEPEIIRQGIGFLKE
ncbi:MAG: threonylcarbamoyl-AMP synthase [Bacteroidaceae bacterium]|nr:threonylcarbamoyl-AMP synthase [Bacteroidaceae bacterium]